MKSVWIFPLHVIQSNFDACNLQGWLAKAKKTSGPTPLPEEPRSEQLEKMLIVVPYKEPAKKGKKQEATEAREVLRRRVSPGNQSRDATASFVQDEGEAEEDEDESAFLHSKKRPTPEDGEEAQPSLAQKRRHRPKLVIPDSSEDEKSKASEEPPKREPWVKPPGGR